LDESHPRASPLPPRRLRAAQHHLYAGERLGNARREGQVLLRLRSSALRTDDSPAVGLLLFDLLIG